LHGVVSEVRVFVRKAAPLSGLPHAGVLPCCWATASSSCNIAAQCAKCSSAVFGAERKMTKYLAVFALFLGACGSSVAGGGVYAGSVGKNGDGVNLSDDATADTASGDAGSATDGAIGGETVASDAAGGDGIVALNDVPAVVDVPKTQDIPLTNDVPEAPEIKALPDVPPDIVVDVPPPDAGPPDVGPPKDVAVGVICGNSLCENGENDTNCPGDCKLVLCALAKCTNLYLVCDASPACAAAVKCAVKCNGDYNCQVGCAGQAGAGQNQFLALAQCAQANGCLVNGPPPTKCGDGVCNGTETNATCPGDCPAPKKDLLTCALNKCGAEVNACFGDVGCSGALQCAGGCNGAFGCIQACLGGLTGNSQVLANKLAGCAISNGCL